MIIAIVSLVMLFITGAIGWWSISLEYEVEDDNDVQSTELTMDFTFKEMSYKSVTTSDWGTQSSEGDEDLIRDLEDVGGNTSLFVTLGIVMTILVIILLCLLIGIIQTRNPGLIMFIKTIRKLAILFAYLAVIFILIAPVYYMIFFPRTFDYQMGGYTNVGHENFYDGSFLGSNNFAFEEEWAGSQYTGEIKWGPGPGWALAIACIILLIITLVHVTSACEEAMKLAPAPQPFPQPQDGWQPPNQQPRKIPPPPPKNLK